MSHTPGPWTEHEGFIIGRFKSDNEIHDICEPFCAPPDAETIFEMNANAQLIAAAPELLEALKALVSTARTFSDCVPDKDKMWTSLDEDALTAAFKAINKATGG